MIVSFGRGARALLAGAAALVFGLGVFAGPAVGAPRASHRLIVELASPPVSASAAFTPAAGRLRADAPAALEQRARITAEQASFLSALPAALPGAAPAAYRTASGATAALSYSLVFNGLAVDPGATPPEVAERALRGMPGVKAVYRDFAHEPTLYASLPLVNAPALWTAVGGAPTAGAGVKVASMDGGVHHDAPMFDGTGYSYPAGFPKEDPGMATNTNGKIIASRAYFRTWDPPAAGDENTWPGVNGTSHGVHTAGIAAGNPVNGTLLGTPVSLGGTAPAAYVMSYRVFYASVSGDQSFYTAEGIKALEDIVADGADVLNCSWGSGPTSAGGALDPLDTALLNASAAGVFVSLAAGNAGPGPATLDHPSSGYVTVAATSTDGTFSDGGFGASAPEPVDPAIAEIPFLRAQFGGAPPPPAQARTWPYLPAVAADPTNPEGCAPFPAGAFTGRAALIPRGTCFFDVKAANAEAAGAELVVISYNAGDSWIPIGPSPGGPAVAVPVISIGYADAQALVAWQAANPATATVTYDSMAHQVGNVPDRVAYFSSRGPGVGNVLKPDLAAPGVNIVSQGYAAEATGEARHLGYGQASGTSMAAPHVAGAAALLQQLHPAWTPAMIKSALMSTAKYLEVYNDDASASQPLGSPAQPLDMGAGRIDLARAADPGVVLAPPSLGFGPVASGTRQLTVTVTSVAAATETYEVSTLGTRNGFGALELLQPLPGFSVSPTSITLAPGESATLTVTFDAATATPGLGEQQGFVVLDGPTHDAHFPVWARLLLPAGKRLLLIDGDGSRTGSTSYPDYRAVYGAALQSLGYAAADYDVVNIAAGAPVPEGAKLSTYEAVVYFSGDSFLPDALSSLAMDRLAEYANNGGAIVSMGQDATLVFGDSFYGGAVLGALRLSDSVSGGVQPAERIVPAAGAPPAFAGLSVDVGAAGDGAHNQLWIDALSATPWFDPGYDTTQGFTPLLRYGDPAIGPVVAIAHREQPTLERPSVNFRGRTVHASFGLEGVNDDVGGWTRAQVLGALLDWALDRPTVSVEARVVKTDPNASLFVATLASPVAATTGVSWLWDFGDGTAPQATTVNRVRHTYAKLGVYTVRALVTDNRGNAALGTLRRLVGEVSATIEPAAARLAGARWRLDRGVWRASGAVIRGVPVGTHTVEFLPVAGWTTPVKRTITVKSGVRRRLAATYAR